MDNTLVQLLLVLFFGGIATYDTVRSRKRDRNESSEKSGESLKFQVKSQNQ